MDVASVCIATEPSRTGSVASGYVTPIFDTAVISDPFSDFRVGHTEQIQPGHAGVVVGPFPGGFTRRPGERPDSRPGRRRLQYLHDPRPGVVGVGAAFDVQGDLVVAAG